jgi:hypothetical protein
MEVIFKSKALDDTGTQSHLKPNTKAAFQRWEAAFVFGFDNFRSLKTNSKG